MTDTCLELHFRHLDEIHERRVKYENTMYKISKSQTDLMQQILNKDD